MIFRYYPEIHLTPIFEIQIHEKKILDTKKISLSKAEKYLTPKAWELK